MGYGGRWSRMIYDGYRRCKLKIVEQSVTRRTFSSGPNVGEAAILQKKKQRKSCFVDGGKKWYHAESRDRVSGLQGWRLHVWHLETAFVIVFVGNGLFYMFQEGRWEAMPLTKRSQFVLPPASADKGVLEKLQEICKGYVLPPQHPQNIKVRAIVQDLMEAFQRKEEGGRIKRNWDVLLVDNPNYLTATFSCGTIVVFTGTLDSCREDAEIAAFIGPEVGHVVARHNVEEHSTLQLISCFFLFTLHAFASSMPSLSKYFRIPFSRSFVCIISWMAFSRLLKKFYSLKMDVEADYIGLLLTAFAGYDPRVALWAREKMGRANGGWSWEKMRARLLILDMEEALSIYKEVIDARDVQELFRFFWAEAKIHKQHWEWSVLVL